MIETFLDAMSFPAELLLDNASRGLATLREIFGFIPRLFRAQALLPRLIEAEAEILSAVLQQRALSRVQKECILLMAAAAHQNRYCATLHYERLRSLGVAESRMDLFLNNHRRAGLSQSDATLVDFSLKLTLRPTSLNSKDIDELRVAGFEDQAILEAVLVIALAHMLCTMSAGLTPEFDFGPRMLPSVPFAPVGRSGASAGLHSTRPYLRSPELSADNFAPFAFFERRLGVVPNLFRAQTLRPDVIEAETRAADLIVANEDVLPQVKKECILLVIAAANLNTYCVAAHCAMLRRLGLPQEESDQIAIDHHQADLSQGDKALLDFARSLGIQRSEFQGGDADKLREHGFSEQQILESVVTSAFGTFLNALVAGLGVVPDFEPRIVFEPKAMQPLSAISSLTKEASDQAVVGEDPDAGWVAKVQEGDVEAFAALIRRHEHRVYRTILGILGDSEEAQDGLQDVFLKAFRHIRDFRGHSKFVTWLMSITNNTALQLLRDRVETESLNEGSQEEEDFRPRQVRSWHPNPEELYSQTEVRDLVEREVMKLPPKYRVVVMLRDIEQLSIDEVATALDLSIAAVKARLFRARLMLRDSMAPYFSVGARRTSS